MILYGQHNLFCPLCLGSEENLVHLFFVCPTKAKVWKLIANWIDLGPIIYASSTCKHLAGLFLLLRPKVSKYLHLLFWLAVIWSI